MSQETNTILSEYLAGIKKIYGRHLKSVILYGSYARGDFTADSDLDIMILVDLSDQEMEPLADALSELDFDYNIEYDIWMMPIVKNIDHFKQWVKVYPFYRNVSAEGVTLYEAA